MCSTRSRNLGTTLQVHVTTLSTQRAHITCKGEKEDNVGQVNKISLSRKAAVRFASLTTAEELENTANGIVPPNKTQGHNSWLKERNRRAVEPTILTCKDSNRLCYVLRLFVLEAKKIVRSIYLVLAMRGIGRELAKNKARFPLLDKNGLRFH